MLKPASSAAALLFVTPLLAEPAQITGSQIHDMVAGSTMEIDTPLGSKVPVQYSEDGAMYGQARAIASYLGSSTDTGRWWVEGDHLCHKWERWFEAKPHCLTLAQEGKKIHWRWQDGTSGTATIAKPPNEPATRTAAASPSAQVKPRPPGTSIDTSFRQSLGVQVPSALPEARPGIAAIQQARPQPAPGEAKAHLASFKVVHVDRSDVLNIRNGPSSDFNAVGSIAPDASGVMLTGPCESRWCPITHQNMSGWVKRSFLESEDGIPSPQLAAYTRERAGRDSALRDSPEAPRACLTQAARALLDRIESKFGQMQMISTCRAGATIAGSGRPSKHASGNAIDFNAGSRKQAVVQWLIANHHAGGTMTYSDMDHIHVDIGPHFVSLGAPSDGGGGGRYARRSSRWTNS